MVMSYFDGIYFKTETAEGEIIFIPSMHEVGKSKKYGCLQIIYKQKAYVIKYNLEEISWDPSHFYFKLGKNVFRKEGCKLDITHRGIRIKGILKFGQFTVPQKEVMGIVGKIPTLQCYHNVYSLFHRVNGVLLINNTRLEVQNEIGYIEGDKGISFPKRYIWTQSSLEKSGSIVIAVAAVPLSTTVHVNGCFAVIFYEGKEYRIATYLGAKLQVVTNRYFVITQKGIIIKVSLIDEGSPVTLYSPINGGMMSTIRESSVATVKYQCYIKGQEILNVVSDRSSYEGQW